MCRKLKKILSSKILFLRVSAILSELSRVVMEFLAGSVAGYRLNTKSLQALSQMRSGHVPKGVTISHSLPAPALQDISPRTWKLGRLSTKLALGNRDSRARDARLLFIQKAAGPEGPAVMC